MRHKRDIISHLARDSSDRSRIATVSRADKPQTYSTAHSYFKLDPHSLDFLRVSLLSFLSGAECL